MASQNNTFVDMSDEAQVMDIEASSDLMMKYAELLRAAINPETGERCRSIVELNDAIQPYMEMGIVSEGDSSRINVLRGQINSKLNDTMSRHPSTGAHKAVPLRAL